METVTVEVEMEEIRSGGGGTGISSFLTPHPLCSNI